MQQLKIPTDLLSSQAYLNLGLEDKVKFLKYAYGCEVVGGLLPENLVYDAMEKNLPDDSPIKYKEWNTIEYKDVADILELLGVEIEEIQPVVYTDNFNDEDYKYLQNMWSKNSSIVMEDNMDIVRKVCNQMFDAAENYPECDDKVVMTLKKDGWNITTYYVPETTLPVLAHTRARDESSTPTYCTSIMRQILPNIQTDKIVKIVGELCLDTDALAILKEAYPDRSFQNTRNSVSSIVHKTIDINLIKKYIHYYVFAVETLEGPYFSSIVETITNMSALGFETPAACIIESKDHFDVCMDFMTDTYKNLEEHIKCDGVILELNSFKAQKEFNDGITSGGQSGLLAIKAGYWYRKIYSAKVLDIIIPPSEVNPSIIAIIEPTVTSSGSVVRRVPLLNFRIAQSFGRYVDKGDTILFTYHSDQVVHFEGLGGIEDADTSSEQ